MNGYRYPNISGNTERERMRQVESYLHQLVEQLNIAQGEAEGRQGASTSSLAAAQAAAGQSAEAESRFNEIKALIIKSADVVDAYYQVIKKRLEGVYVAQSDFGIYSERTSQSIKANSSEIETLYSNVQEIVSDVEGVVNRQIEVEANINTGLLYYDETGAPVYGLEIGQRTEIDGEEVFNKYARFTADKLAFYDQNGTEVAYISDYKLVITWADIETLGLGAFRIDTSRGFELRYVGRE